MFGATKSTLWQAWLLTSDFITSLVTTPTFLTATKTRYQIKAYPTSTTTSQTDIASLRFNNLVIGKTYRVLAQMKSSLGSGSARRNEMYVRNGATALFQVFSDNPLSTNGGTFTSSCWIDFVATATTINVDLTVVASATMIGDGTTGGTFLLLEELPNHEVTTAWT